MSHFQDGSSDVIWCWKVLPSGECTHSICSAHMLQHPPAAHWRFCYSSWSYFLRTLAQQLLTLKMKHTVKTSAFTAYCCTVLLCCVVLVDYNHSNVKLRLILRGTWWACVNWQRVLSLNRFVFILSVKLSSYCIHILEADFAAAATDRWGEGAWSSKGTKWFRVNYLFAYLSAVVVFTEFYKF